MVTNDFGLRVAIVGLGIAGLAAARILREKHGVTVYERGEPSTVIGGQLRIANFPNSTLISDAADRNVKFDDNCTCPGILSILKGQSIKV
ncbi:hypothetical protein O1611_g5275 [Lasiodiplodia mahajangana]|uniref:Uncharacterized protein n=1 Tax=Lasiodiplodia mahajangana TaxID=1108764 RepID=A0ACC2JLI1_9PEZI|nr:hypothetical protein O1611_g5275 [Lasiodiplodia mahajangana]